MATEKRTSSGTWKFEHFGSGIIKTSFEPAIHYNNEQVSNAVIIQALKNSSPGTKLRLDNNNQTIDYAFLNKRLKLASTKQPYQSATINLY